jgi:hypothetical protein
MVLQEWKIFNPPREEPAIVQLNENLKYIKIKKKKMGTKKFYGRVGLTEGY